MISIAPTLAGMASYPFVRLEEARRRLGAQGVDVIDFGKGDPNEPTDPMIRQALVDALPERAPYPLAQGLPELRAAVAGWCERRFGVALDPDTDRAHVRLGEAIFSPQVPPTPMPTSACRHLSPRIPSTSAARLRGADVRLLPLLRERLLPISTRSTTKRAAPRSSGQLSINDGRLHRLFYERSPSWPR